MIQRSRLTVALAVGFEPTDASLRHRISRPAPSTARTSQHIWQELEESNLCRWFWRPLCCHCTKLAF